MNLRRPAVRFSEPGIPSNRAAPGPDSNSESAAPSRCLEVSARPVVDYSRPYYILPGHFLRVAANLPNPGSKCEDEGPSHKNSVPQATPCTPHSPGHARSRTGLPRRAKRSRASQRRLSHHEPQAPERPLARRRAHLLAQAHRPLQPRARTLVPRSDASGSMEAVSEAAPPTARPGRPRPARRCRQHCNDMMLVCPHSMSISLQRLCLFRHMEAECEGRLCIGQLRRPFLRCPNICITITLVEATSKLGARDTWTTLFGDELLPLDIFAAHHIFAGRTNWREQTRHPAQTRHSAHVLKAGLDLDLERNHPDRRGSASLHGGQELRSPPATPGLSRRCSSPSAGGVQSRQSRPAHATERTSRAQPATVQKQLPDRAETRRGSRKGDWQKALANIIYLQKK